MIRRPARSALVPDTTLFRSGAGPTGGRDGDVDGSRAVGGGGRGDGRGVVDGERCFGGGAADVPGGGGEGGARVLDRKGAPGRGRVPGHRGARWRAGGPALCL